MPVACPWTEWIAWQISYQAIASQSCVPHCRTHSLLLRARPQAFNPSRQRPLAGGVDEGVAALFELLAMGCATPEERPATREALASALQICHGAYRPTLCIVRL